MSKSHVANNLTRIGEKFLQWSDTSPSMQEILDGTTLYWLTESFPRSIYPYRSFYTDSPGVLHQDKTACVNVPTQVTFLLTDHFCPQICPQTHGLLIVPFRVGAYPNASRSKGRFSKLTRQYLTDTEMQSGNLVWSRDHTEGGHFAGEWPLTVNPASTLMQMSSLGETEALREGHGGFCCSSLAKSERHEAVMSLQLGAGQTPTATEMGSVVWPGRKSSRRHSCQCRPSSTSRGITSTVALILSSAPKLFFSQRR